MDKFKLILLGLRITVLDWWGDCWERYIEARFKKTRSLSERRVVFVYVHFLTPVRRRQDEEIERFHALKEKILKEMDRNAGDQRGHHRPGNG